MPDKWCNCDSGLDTWLSDEGYLTDMTYLPVRKFCIKYKLLAVNLLGTN